MLINFIKINPDLVLKNLNYQVHCKSGRVKQTSFQETIVDGEAANSSRSYFK